MSKSKSNRTNNMELEEIRKCAEKEYNELMNTINTVNPKSKPSKEVCEKMVNLMHTINIKCMISKFADYREVMK